MKRIIYILLLAMGMATVAPMVSIVENTASAVYAADARAKAQAQREKERAKRQKEREKAKAKAAKEREKAAAQKKKEQAKAAAQKQKDRDRAKAQQAKAKSNTKAQANAKTKASSKPQLTAAEEKAAYMAQVAAIDKANAKAQAYNERDIAHRLGFWGLVGYSNLFTSGIRYEEAVGLGFKNKDKGFVGGGLGIGYQLRYKQFLFTTGLEFTSYNSIMGLSNTPDGHIMRTFGMNPYPNTMKYTYDFSSVNDQIVSGFAQIPLLFGMELKKVPLFWQAGVKVGMGVMGISKLKGNMTTTIKDEELIVDLEKMYSHALVTDEKLSRPSSSVKFGLNVAASAEIGMYLDPWIKSAAKVRVSVFADYGFLNALSYKAADGAQDLPMQLAVPGESPLDFKINSALQTTSAADAKVNPFLVGAKIAVWFDLPRKNKQLREYPKAPTPRMGVYMYDENSALALGGVAVEITNTETGKTMQKNTNRQGILQGRFAPGTYRISAIILRIRFSRLSRYSISIPFVCLWSASLLRSSIPYV